MFLRRDQARAIFAEIVEIGARDDLRGSVRTDRPVQAGLAIEAAVERIAHVVGVVELARVDHGASSNLRVPPAAGCAAWLRPAPPARPHGTSTALSPSSDARRLPTSGCPRRRSLRPQLHPWRDRTRLQCRAARRHAVERPQFLLPPFGFPLRAATSSRPARPPLHAEQIVALRFGRRGIRALRQLYTQPASAYLDRVLAPRQDAPLDDLPAQAQRRRLAEAGVEDLLRGCSGSASTWICAVMRPFLPNAGTCSTSSTDGCARK